MASDSLRLGLVPCALIKLIFRRKNYIPQKTDLRLLKQKINSAKREYPLNTPVRVFINQENTKRKSSHNIIWSKTIYYVADYKCPASPLEDVGIRLKINKHLPNSGRNKVKGIFYFKELKKLS